MSRLLRASVLAMVSAVIVTLAPIGASAQQRPSFTYQLVVDQR